MRQTMARKRGLTATLKRRWWIFPIVLTLVAAALVLRALSAPLAVSASVTDGDHAVARSSSVALTFNQDMDVASVTKGFRIIPSVPYTMVVKSPRAFEFRPQLEPDTAYKVQVIGARKGVGFGSENYSVAFRTEPAPKVAGATFNDAPLADGQLAVALRGNLKVTFSQPTVRPQTGMQQADMIYEYISEFGIPRLSAVYWHPPSSLIGPVRSCRLITVQLEQMYRGMIYCSGANDYVLGQVWKWPNVVYDYNYMYAYMYRAADRAAPHNVIARPDQITAHTAQANLPALNYDVAPAHPDAPLPGATPATSVSIKQHSAVWRYDANRREYLKWQDGLPFTNVGTGQVHAKNLIIEKVTSYIDRNHANTGVHGTYNTEYYELAGEGTADIYSDGGMIHVTWKHPNRDLPVVYYDASGNPVDLNTGLTWVHVIGSDQ